MTQLTLTIPSDIPHLLKLSDEDFAREMQMLLAVKLFEMGKLTSGKAAELAGVPRVLFLHLLDQYGIAAINLDASEADHEVDSALGIGHSSRAVCTVTPEYPIPNIVF